MRKVRLDYLKKLATFLGIVNEDEFDFNKWGAKRANACGFNGCAIGWGIHANIAPPGLVFGDNGGGKMMPMLGDLTDDAAVAKAYGISKRDVADLFLPGGRRVKGGSLLGVTPKHVARGINQFIREKRAA